MPNPTPLEKVGFKKRRRHFSLDMLDPFSAGYRIRNKHGKAECVTKPLVFATLHPAVGFFISSVIMIIPLKILPQGEGLPYPFYATPQSAGMDLFAAVREPKILAPGERTLIPTGLSIALPQDTEAQIRSRSGLALKNGVVVLNAPGTIDADYRGEIGVILINLGQDPFTVERGQRIAQMVFSRYETVKWEVVKDLPETQRSSGGFGSTGLR